MTQPITGYRELSDGEVALINEIKAVGARVGELVKDIDSRTSVDHRWAAIAKTQLQEGFMALTRAVAQPTNF